MAAKTDVAGSLRAPREVIGPTLVELIRAEPDVVVLDADLGLSTRLDAVEEECPENLIQLGVAEQNAVGIAAGLVYTGHRPVFVSMAMFSLGLPWTQLRQVAYAGLPVVVIGTHAGVDMGPDGGTHQFMEDLALARVMPGLATLTPCDSAQTAAAIRWAVSQREQPVYIRVGRHPVAQLHDGEIEYSPGTSEVLADHGADVLLVAEGSTAALAVAAAEVLDARGIGARVLHLASLKPLDGVGLVRASGDVGRVVTIENHSALGGLGSAVAEVLAPLRQAVHRIGTPDRFGFSASAEELREFFGLTPEAVAATVAGLVAGTAVSG
ncbi:MAG: transketolase family protein [Propionibacteriaceae bacterium]|nr:transketolase family protein [Propionibacteriaceae bacterium]